MDLFPVATLLQSRLLPNAAADGRDIIVTVSSGNQAVFDFLAQLLANQLAVDLYTPCLEL